MLNTKQRKVTKKQPKRKLIRNGGRRDNSQDLDRLGRGNLRLFVQNRKLVLPDMFTETLVYAVSQTNIFNTAATVGSIAWAMNDLFAFRNGVNPTIISGATSSAGAITGDLERYRRYRVLSVKFKVRLQSREATNPQTFVLHPSTALPNVATNTEFSWLMMQQSNCIRTLGPIGSGNAVQDLTMSYNPEKFFGEQYHQQDEYTGTITGTNGAFTSPTTPVYMGLSFHNTNTNTLTTGGAVMTVQAIIKVLIYEVDRDEDPATFKSSEQNLESIETQIAQLKLRAKQLARSTST
jgi:hypothetical protein